MIAVFKVQVGSLYSMVAYPSKDGAILQRKGQGGGHYAPPPHLFRLVVM